VKVLVTGASGFVGGHLLQHLCARDLAVNAVLRRRDVALPAGATAFAPIDLDEAFDCSEALRGCDAAIHLAARVHVMQDTSADPLAAYRKGNTAATLRLAEQAAAAGVRRFVFLSSIKVNGEETQPGQPFTIDSVPRPRDAYGISKLEAENGLREIADRTGMQVVSIRTPLVYGPGVRANFLSMMNWLRRGIPLPFGSLRHNRRSLMAVGNLVDAIARSLTSPAAANRLLLVADGEDLSTAELLVRLGAALGHPARLVPLPPKLLALAASAAGLGGLRQRLLGSLQVDGSGARRILDWTPPLSVDEGLRLTADDYLRRAS
jgi:nucleoside-diphosphate-sugar epimerase